MALQTAQLQDEGSINWLRSIKALSFLKEGIEDFTDKRVANFHGFLQREVSQELSQQKASACSSCTYKNVEKHNRTWRVRCSSNVCSTWFKHILKKHADKHCLVRTNLKPQLWPKAPWEVAKCFLPENNEHVTAAKCADVAAILKLMIYCSFMYKFCPDVPLVRQVLGVRNTLMHSSNQSASDAQLREGTDKMIQLLRSLDDLSPAEIDTIQRAIDNINKLRSKMIDIPLDRDFVLGSRMHALEEDKKDNPAGKDTGSREEQCNALRGKLIRHYKDTCLLVQNPMEKTDVGLENMFIEPVIRVLRQSKGRDGLNNVNDKPDCLSCRKIFYTDDYKARQIYITGDAGLGKSMLCKHLVELWCKAHGDCVPVDSEESESDSDVETTECESSSDGDIVRGLFQGLRILDYLEQMINWVIEMSKNICEQFIVEFDESKCLFCVTSEESEIFSLDDFLRLQLYFEMLIEGQRKLFNMINEEYRKNSREENSRSDESECDSDVKSEESESVFIEEVIRFQFQFEKTVKEFRQILNNINKKKKKIKSEESRQSDKSKCDFDVKSEESKSVSCRDNLSRLHLQAAIKLKEMMKLIYCEDETIMRKENKQCDESKCDSDVKEYESFSDGSNFSHLLFELKRKFRESKQDLIKEVENVRQTRKQRKKERQIRREDNIQILSQFEFLFYITLRDSPSEYKITEMIQSQILQHYDDIHVCASELLQKECCLVIIDGLDEWERPKDVHVPQFMNSGLPFRHQVNRNSVLVTTTRPWKFDVLNLKDSEVDKHAKLCGFDQLSSFRFCSKVIKLLNKCKGQRKKKKEFYRALKQKGLGHFQTMPAILLQLICLWFDDQELCTSRVQLYCSMLNLLLQTAQTKVTGHSISTHCDVMSEVSLPKCFMDHTHCKHHQQLIKCLSKVAFESLADKKENQSVFKSSQMVMYGIDKDSMKMCLQSGILSQNRMLEKCSVRETKLSFLHPNLQGFLASVYIANQDDVQAIFKRVKDLCGTLLEVFKMFEVLLFLFGMSSGISRMLLEQLGYVVTTDENIQFYRQSIAHWLMELVIQCIQKWVSECVNESDINGHTYDNIYLEDLYVDKTNVSAVERLLLGGVESGIKSMYINTADLTDGLLKRITDLLLRSQVLKKLYINDSTPSLTVNRPILDTCGLVSNSPDLINLMSHRFPIATLSTILQNCCNHLTCLVLISKVTLTDCEVTSICLISNKFLMALSLKYVSLTHVDKIRLLNGLSQSTTIRQLCLAFDCTDHVQQCTARIDVSTIIQLQSLELWYMCVDNLLTMPQCVKLVNISSFTLPVADLCAFARMISQKRCYMKVELDFVNVIEEGEDRVDLETFLRSCHGLTVITCHQCDNSIEIWDIHFHSNIP